MFALGRKSLAEVEHNGTLLVYPTLVRAVRRAIKITPVDFSIHDGIRTLVEQQEYVSRRVSRTLRSMHLEQPDGYGHAVDLVPYINKKLRWEWEPIYEIAKAMHIACCEEDLLIRWGGVWDRLLNDLAREHLAEEVQDYVAREKARRGPKADVFIDGPHYEVYSPFNPKWQKIKRF